MAQDRKLKPRGCSYAVRDFLLQYPCEPSHKIILLTLAAFANPDGTSIFPGSARLVRLGIHRRKIKPATDFWEGLGVLVLVTPERPRHAAEYRIDISRMDALLSSTVEPSVTANSVPKQAQLGSKHPSTRYQNRPNSVPTLEPHGSIDGNRRRLEHKTREEQEPAPAYWMELHKQVEVSLRLLRYSTSPINFPAHFDSFKKNVVAIGVPWQEAEQYWQQLVTFFHRKMAQEQAIDRMLAWVNTWKTENGGYDDPEFKWLPKFDEAYRAKYAELGLPIH